MRYSREDDSYLEIRTQSSVCGGARGGRGGKNDEGSVKMRHDEEKDMKKKPTHA